MKFNKWTLALAATGVVSLAGIAQADESHPVNTALSSTTLSGYVDTAAIWNFGRGAAVVNRWSNTDASRQDGFNLNAVKLQLEKPIDEGTWSAGYKAELMFGPDAAMLPGNIGGQTALKQAYVALRAPVGNGIDFKVGQFDPIIGYEVTDSYANPNFSRGLAFNNLQPLGHQGVLATYQFTDWFGASVGVANTANNAAGGSNARGPVGINSKGTFADPESYKAYMVGLVFKAPESWGWAAGSSLYGGVVKGLEVGDNNDPVNYYVGGSLATPIKELTLGASYDYQANGSFAQSYANVIAGYISYQVTEKLRLNNRFEYGTSSGGLFVAGVNDEEIIGVTSTLDYQLFANVVSRAEFRWDTIVSGSTLRGIGGYKNDLSVALNLIYKF